MISLILRIVFLNVVIAVSFPAMASTVTQQQIGQCVNRGNEYSPELAVEACTAAIMSGGWSGKGLAWAYANRGNAYQRRGDSDRAIADYGEAIRLDPGSAPGYRGRAYVYEEAKGDHDRAIADFNEAIRLDPRDAYAYNGRGTAYYGKSDYDHAAADFDNALLIDPGNADLLNQRCWMRALSGRDLQGALADCNESLRLRPGVFYVLNSRGFVQLSLGAFDKAIEDYDAAIARNAREADSLYGRGIAKTESGDVAGGKADIAAARAIKADIADAHPWPGAARPNP